MRLLLLLSLGMLSACALQKGTPEFGSVHEGIRDMHLSGFRGYWAPGMISVDNASIGRFLLDYDRRKAHGAGSSSSAGGGRVQWEIHHLEVIDPRRAERGVFHRMIVLHGRFVVDGGASPGTYRRALVHVTHFESAPPWMCVHVISDDWNLRSNAQAARYSPPAARLYFHAVGGV